MKSLGNLSRLVVLVALGAVPKCDAQQQKTNGGFREVLEIVGIDSDILGTIIGKNLTVADWEVLTQVVRRFEQHEADLARWTLPKKQLTAELVGELFELEGTIVQVAAVHVPQKIAERLELKQLFRSQVKLDDGYLVTVLSTNIPQRWDLSQPLAEPVSLRGVLLSASEEPLLLTTHLHWFPTSGLPSGMLLLARFGMDAALWDDILQRSPFISPERGREAVAFYACLAALKKAPAAELAKLSLENIARMASASQNAETKLQKRIAASVNEQAERGLSSVAPLFLEPERQGGELVRIEGTARRAIRISVDEKDHLAASPPIDEYFELEVFTADSQNLPLVCCVTSLPAGFPTGDAIRAGVRLDGVFFKSWRYRSRKVVDGPGETATQQQRYTPVVLAATVTWLRQTPAGQSWWGLVGGGLIFAAMIFGLVRMVISFRQDRRTRLPEIPPDFSKL